MTNTVLIKRSSVANSVPQSGNLQPGELAINYNDGNLFYKNASNVVTTIASNKFVSVSGNVTGGNIVTGGVVTATGNITSSGNISATYFIGNGSLLTGITAGTSYSNANVADYLASGTDSSNIVTTANLSGGNVLTSGIVSSAGITSSGTVNFVSSGNISLGNVENVHIAGGTNGYVLSTNGSGNLTWVAQTGGTGGSTITVDDFTGNGVQTEFTLSVTPPNIDATTVNYNGVIQLRTGYSLSGANVVFPTAPANGASIEVTTISASLTGAAGSNTQVQYNNNGNTSASPAFTFNATSNTLSVTGDIYANYFVGNGSLLTGIATGTPAKISNGTSEINIGTTGGNANVSIGGTSNVVVFASSGVIVTGVVSVSSNITGGNVLTGGLISATSTVTGGNLATGGTASATGNITGGNLLTGGLISATSTITSAANITGGNVLTGGLVSATSNITGGNVLTGGLISATGNLTSGNVSTNIITASGNVTGANIITGGLITASGNLAAGNISTGNVNLSNINVAGFVTSDLLPLSNVTYNLGNSTLRWNELWLASSTIYIGNSSISANSEAMTLTNPAGGSLTIAGASSDLVAVNVTATGNVVTGNLSAAGILSSTGNVIGGNIVSNGIVSAGGTGYFGSGLTVVGNITASGNINYQNVTDLVVGDPLIYVAANNTSDSVDIGMVGSANVSGTYQHLGFVRDHSSGTWRLFANVVAEPTTVIDWANSSYAPFAAGAITSNATVSAAGTVTGGNLATGGTASAAGNVTAGNVLTSGLISATGNITAGNVNAGANVNATTHTGTTVSMTGNVTGGNVLTDGLISAASTITAANITGSNFLTSGLISAAGNVTGNYIIGNGSQLTGLPASYANANVAAYLASGTNSSNIITTANVSGGNVLSSGLVSAASFIGSVVSVTANVTGGNILTSGLISATSNITSAGNISATYYIGNGSLLTGIATGTPTKIVNGTSEANIGTANGNANISIAGTSNVAVFANTGVYVTGLISASGNITGGNINTTGVSGNITGANVISATTLSATANVTGGNINTGGLVSATGNIVGSVFIGNGAGLTSIAGANVTGTVANATYATSAGTVTTAAQPNITSVGTLTSVTVTGNATAGNLLTSGVVSATGNVTGNYFIGNGSQLTGLPAGYSNAQVASYLASGTDSSNIITTANVTGGNILTSGLISATSNIISAGNISATYYIGNGSLLTGIAAGTYSNANVAAYLPTYTGNISANNVSVTTSLTGNIISASGNVTGANILTGGLISATGNIVGNNIVTTGSGGDIVGVNVVYANVLSTTGNVNSGNILTGGLISATGSITGNAGLFNGGLSVVGNITATGNINYQSVTDLVVGDPLIYIAANNTSDIVDIGIVGSANVSGVYQHIGLVRDHTDAKWKLFGNVVAEPTTTIDWANAVYQTLVAGNVSSTGTVVGTGNITGGNVLTGGLISATGNITSAANISGTYFIGNGSLLTGISTGGNASKITNGTSEANIGTANGNANISIAGTSNVAVFATTGVYVSGNIVTTGTGGNITGANVILANVLSTTGNITGSYFIGNGSQLTGVTATANASGSNTQVQFNDGGSFGASANLTFDKSTNTLNATNVTANGSPLATTGKAIAMAIVFGF